MKKRKPRRLKKHKHQYRSDGGSRDPECRICGLWDDDPIHKVKAK
jgi:hypothetical protein